MESLFFAAVLPLYRYGYNLPAVTKQIIIDSLWTSCVCLLKRARVCVCVSFVVSYSSWFRLSPLIFIKTLQLAATRSLRICRQARSRFCILLREYIELSFAWPSPSRSLYKGLQGASKIQSFCSLVSTKEIHPATHLPPSFSNLSVFFHSAFTAQSSGSLLLSPFYFSSSPSCFLKFCCVSISLRFRVCITDDN